MTQNLVLQLRVTHRALMDLYWFVVQPHQSITEKRFDECFDTLTSLLEAANNEKHRLITPKG